MLLDTLRIFVTVAEQRHFSNAAKLLNLSQPGVSLHIRNLENEMEARLLHRSPKQVSLTEAGELLYNRAKQMLMIYEETRQDIHLLQDEVTGSLHIGASFTIGEYILPKRLTVFTQQYPLVNMQVTIGNTEEIIKGVSSGTLEMGMIEGEYNTSDLEVIPYMKDHMIVIAPADHPLSSMRVIEANNLENQIWVMRESGSGTREFSDQFIKNNSLVMKRSYIFNTSQGVKEAVASGMGIAILSRWIVRRELEIGEMVELQIKNMKLERDFTIILHKDRSATMAVNVVMKHLLSVNPYFE
jgi:DNA-binding transcriptional LysR family regulator